jgi:hypothetical protein
VSRTEVLDILSLIGRLRAPAHVSVTALGQVAPAKAARFSIGHSQSLATISLCSWPGELPLPKLFKGAILASQPHGIRRMSAQNGRAFPACRFIAETGGRRCLR